MIGAIFFSNLALLSRVRPFGVTYEEVALCALSRLIVMLVGDVAPRQRQSRHCLWRDLVTSSILT
jgi:hypothetical protein